MNRKSENGVIKGKAAKSNIYAYSREAFDSLLLESIGFIIMLAIYFFVLYIYLPEPEPFDATPLTLLILGAWLFVSISVHGVELLMFIDLRRGDFSEKVVRLISFNTEYVRSAKFGISRMEKYFHDRLLVDRIIINCIDSDAGELRVRTVLSFEKRNIIRRLMKNSAEVKIRYLRRSKVLLSFEEIHSGDLGKKEAVNLCRYLNSKV